MSKRIYRWPEALDILIEREVGARGFSFTDPKPLAAAIRNLSDLYTKERARIGDIWADPARTAAYLAYFLPLNYLRLKAVVDEGRRRNFFKGFDRTLDFGSGPGTAHLLWKWDGRNLPTYGSAWEKSKMARDLHASLLPETPPRFVAGVHDLPSISRTVGIFSYSLNELDEPPKWLESLGGLLIVEPSLQRPARRLLAWRESWLAAGYKAWAPCPHQERCPLLHGSKTDWCHDRIFSEAPEWFRRLEEHLPMENRSLTFSYLLLRKETPPALPPRTARIVGDTLFEKGKIRQMVCRGPERVFFSWLRKAGEPARLERGTLVQVPENAEEKGSELRIGGAPVLALDKESSST